MSARSIPLKQWFYEESVRRNLSRSAIVMRYYRGCYLHLEIERISPKRVNVIEEFDASGLPDYHRDLL